jgi:hypothetical protein
MELGRALEAAYIKGEKNQGLLLFPPWKLVFNTSLV